MIIEGNLSVKAAVLGGRRDVYRLIIDPQKKDKDTSFIIHRAKERGIDIQYLPREEIDAMASGRTHGGLIAECGYRRYQTESECLKGQPFVCLLEGAEDPYNLGYIIRTLYSAGCTGLLLGTRNWQNAESTVLKASAGAFEYLPVVCSADLPESIRYFKKQGLFCAAAMRRDAIPYTEADFRRPLLLAIGGEMRGLSAAVRKEMDQNVYIPYANDFRNALNAAAAAAVLAYEVLRQNGSSL